MTSKPQNHVTRAQDALRQPQAATVWPEVPEDLLVFLEAAYRPRCYTASGETLEEHLQYAGAVDLVGTLRVVFEAQKAERIAADPEDPYAVSVEVLRGSEETD